MALLLACAFAVILGFAAHRASICTVRAVAEMMSARTAYMLASIGKSSLWVIAITVPFLWLLPASVASVNGWQLTAAALLGGLIFGIGAAVNGACAYSTMARMVDGDMGMIVSLIGFALGIIGFVLAVDAQWLTRPVQQTPWLAGIMPLALAASLALIAWGAVELIRLWRTRPAGADWLGLIFAPRYRLSTAAFIVGLSSAAIFILIGSPGYSATLQNVIEVISARARSPPRRAGYYCCAYWRAC